MTNELAIRLSLQGLSIVKSGFKDLENTVDHAAKSVEAAQSLLTGLAGAFAGYLSVTKLLHFADMADVAEKQIRQLNTALAATGEASAFPMLEAQAKALSAASHKSVGDILEMQRTLLELGVSAKNLSTLVPAALDIAGGLGRDPHQVAVALARATAGQMGGLNKLGIRIDDLSQLNAELARFAGQMGASATSSDMLKVSTEALQEEIGKLVKASGLDVWEDKLDEALRRVAAGMQKWRETHPQLMADLRALASLISGTILDNLGMLVGVLGTLTAAITALGVAGATLKFGTFFAQLPLVSTALGGAVVAFKNANAAVTLFSGAVAGPATLANLSALVATLGTVGTVLTAVSVAVASVGVAFAGFKLGEWLSQVKVAGVALVEWLADFRLRMMAMWQNVFGMMTDAEYADYLARLDEQIAGARKAAQEAMDVTEKPVNEAEPSATYDRENRPGLTKEFKVAEEMKRTGEIAAQVLQRRIDQEHDALELMRLQRQELNNREITAKRLAAENQKTYAVAVAAYEKQKAANLDLMQDEALQLADEKAAQDFAEAKVKHLGEQADLEKEITAIARERLNLAEREDTLTAAGQARAQYQAFLRQRQYEQEQNQGGVGDGITAGIEQTIVSLGTTVEIVASNMQQFFNTAISSISDGLTGLIMQTKTWAEALREIGNTILTQLVNSIVRMAVTWIIQQALMATVGKTIAASSVAANVPIAAGLSAIYAAPATLATIASFGGAAAAAPGLISIAQGAVLAGSILQAEQGGLIPGGRQLIMVNERGQEFVLPAEAVQAFGPDVLASLQEGQLPVAMAAEARRGAAPSQAPSARERTLNLALFDNRTDLRRWETNVGRAEILNVVRQNNRRLV